MNNHISNISKQIKLKAKMINPNKRIKLFLQHLKWFNLVSKQMIIKAKKQIHSVLIVFNVIEKVKTKNIKAQMAEVFALKLVWINIFNLCK